MTETTQVTAWSPLKIKVYRFLWLATLCSNIGTWMHEVGAGWLMTTLSSSPVMVALVQTAVTLPAALVLLPSGALSDILDRRLYLMYGNIAMGITALILGTLVFTGAINPWSLLGLTFILGLGMAMIMPAWQAIIPEVVPRSELQGAVALNTMGMNVSRVIGSLIAGIVISYVGIAAVFLINAATYIFIIWVLATWKREPLESKLPPEKFWAAIRTGLRYARYSPPLQATIIRGFGFYFFASIMWAMLPLIARDLLKGGPEVYSYLFASISIGAISSALLLPRLRRRLNNDQLLTLASFVFAGGMIITATFHSLYIAIPGLAFCGSAWITVMTCSQVSAQTALPNWIKSRGLAVFLTFFMGSLALGPFVWGNVVALSTLPTALISASIGISIAALFTRRWPISGNDLLDHTPSGHWKQPTPQKEVSPHRGPVMVTVRYQVPVENRQHFLELMQQLGKARRRDGASDWHIMEDTNQENHYLEFFLVTTWLDHLRQHERISNQDARIQHDIRNLLTEGSKPEVSHYVTG